MIVGEVNAYHEAIVHLLLSSANGPTLEVDAVLDTGFSGSLTLPAILIATLGLPWRTRGLVVLVNGTRERCDIYAATVIWDDEPRHILVEAADTDPLLGMDLLYGHDLRMQVVAGGPVTIEAVP